MPEAKFVFEIVEQGGGAPGAAGTPAGKGGDPQATPQPSQRTQQREEAESQGGGAPKVLDDAQKKNREEQRKRPKPKPPVAKPDPSAISEQAKLFGTALAQRFGLGGVATALGTVALPVAAAGAAVGVIAGVSRRQAELAQRLRPFSADLAISGAREQLRTTLQNVELAGRFGPQLAEAERQRGRFGAAAGRLKAEVVAGPLGQDVGNIVELGARALEGINAVVARVNDLLPGAPILGPLGNFNQILTDLGIAVDRLKNFEGNLRTFRDFPHATVDMFPPGIGPNQTLKPTGGEPAEFTTDQDLILDQL